MQKNEWTNRLLSVSELSLISLSPVLNNFHEGVIITDHDGYVIYINDAQTKIDDLNQADILGRKITEIYRVDDGVSPLMHCLRTGEQIDNLACYYRTHLGKVVNSIHNIFPLLDAHKIMGAICFIRDFGSLGEIVERSALDLNISRFNNMQTFIIPDNSGVPVQQYRKQTFSNNTLFTFDDIIGDNDNFIKAVSFAKMSCSTPSPVMLYGETGTGKELFAQSIHNASIRRNNSYVAINCAAIPENLLEGILFGTTKGAFTGAMDKEGLFEKANGGTILLDEVNSMPIGLQAKLLRTLQERKVRRVGSLNEINIDIKIISSTNEPPQTACNSGKLRKDLFYRLGVVFIQIPPLRDRKQDMEKLIGHFLHKCNTYLKKNINTISAEVMQLFYSYHWPGNVRELEHVIEGAMNMMEDRDIVKPEHLSFHIGSFERFSRPSGSFCFPRSHAYAGFTEDYISGDKQCRVIQEGCIYNNVTTKPHKTLSELQIDNEIKNIRLALQDSRGNVAGAARKLGTSPQLLHYKIKRYEINRPDFK